MRTVYYQLTLGRWYKIINRHIRVIVFDYPYNEMPVPVSFNANLKLSGTGLVLARKILNHMASAGAFFRI